MAESYKLHTVTTREVKQRGLQPLLIREIDTQMAPIAPEDGVDLADLRTQEVERARQVRKFQDGSAIGALLGGRDELRQARTSLFDLAQNVPSGTTIYERIKAD